MRMKKFKNLLKRIVKERGKFSITVNGLQWAYSRELCFMENVLLSWTIALIDTRVFFVVMTYSRFARTQIGPVPILHIPRILNFISALPSIVGLILNFTLYVHLTRKTMHISRVVF